MADRRVKVIFEAEIAKFKQGMTDAAKETEKLAKATETAGKAVDERMQKINAVAAADQKAAKAAGLLYNAQGQLADANGKVLSSTQAAAHGVEAFSEAVYLSGHEAGVAAAATEAAAKKAAEAAETQKAAWETVAPVMMAAGAGMVAGVALAVKKYADFDKAMSSVQAATHETTGNMGLLREAAISAGADTAFSAEEAAKGIEELAKAGVSTQSILSGGLNGALSLAAAGELAVGDAAEIAATAMTQFKLSGDKIPHLADLLAAGAGKAQGSVADLGAALNQSGLVASATGLTIEETTGTLAAFASNGLLGSDAGTSFKSMLQALQNPSKKASLVMEELGINMYDANGEFAGMTNLAAQLTKGLGDKTQAERDAAMATIFGSDAVRAANVLYSEGAEGIANWEKQVNSAGYAAQTAAIMQDNLAGDLEKLGGAFDTALIQSGGAANDVLRRLVQGAEGAMDAFGKIPAPILGTATALAGVTGAALLVGGAFVTAVPKVAETVSAMRDLAAHSPKAAKGLRTAGKAAGVAAGAFVLLQAAVAANNATAPESKGVEAFIQDYNKLRGAAMNLDDTFKNMEFAKDSSHEGNINNLGDALSQLAPKFGDVAGHLGSFGATVLGAENGLPQMKREIEGLSDAMATAVGGGDFEGASKVFKQMVESAEAGGKGISDLTPYMDSYLDSLREVANQYGANITEGELMVWALEGIAPASVAAAQGAETTAGALEEVGLAASGAVESMDKFLESLFATGLATMSSKDAAFQWADSLRDTKDEIEKILKTQKELGPVLEKGGKDFNKNTDSGSAALELFHGKLREGMEVAETYAKDTSKSQEDVQKQLTSTYNAGVKAAEGFGMGTTEAEALTRATLGIPDGVSVDTWISDQAESGAKSTKEAVDGIPDMKNVKVVVTDEGTVSLTKEQIQGIKDRTVSTQVTDDGTILTVQGGINNIEGTTEQILVSDDGTAVVVQQRINEVSGKTEYITVSDGGTVAGVQAKINGIADGYAQIRVTIGGDASSHVSTGPGGRGGLTRASGGSVFGAGTETSDSIPAWLSTNEHVLSAREVRGLGGHSAVERLRAMARGGDAPAFATGGAVGRAESKVTSTKRAYDRIDGKATNRLRKLAAKDQWEAAKAELADVKKSSKASADAAKKTADARKKAAEDEKARQGRLSESRRDLRVDLRRGNITDAFTSGSGMGQVDNLLAVSRNKDYSAGKRKAAARDAAGLEKALASLTKRSEGLEKALAAAKEKADELRAVREAVASGLRDEFSLSGLLGEHRQDIAATPFTAQSISNRANKTAKRIEKFASRLNRLRKMGYGETIIQEVAAMGSEDGMFAANALINATDKERGSIVRAYGRLDRASGLAGDYVTSSMYKGGVDAADGLVEGLESKTKDVESAFYQLGKSGEKAFRRSLDMHSPSRTLFKAGTDAGDGVVGGGLASIPKVEDAFAKMGYAAEGAFSPMLSVPPSREVARYAAQPAAGNQNLAAAVGAAVHDAMSAYQPMVSIGGTKFYGVMSKAAHEARKPL